MYSSTKSGAAMVFCAGLFCTGVTWAQSASENAVQVAMDACEQEKEMDDARMNCFLGATAMQQSIQASNEGSEGVIHYDFNDFNDADAQKSAKQALNDAMNNCETEGGKAGMKESCRLEAFNQYQEAMGQ